MPADSDLREIYRLPAECFENHVVHTSYHTDRALSVRKVKVERRWDNTTRIGHGSFGEVWLQRSNGEERAVKKLSKYRMDDFGIDYKRELDAMACFSRPRIREEQVIVAFLGWFESDDDVFLAMEYVPFGDLSKCITTGEIKENDAKQIARDMLDALIILHEEGFTHRDIKPQNVFVMQKSPMWWVKLGDFGITKRIDNEQTALRTRIGTARYLAPEIEDDDFPDSEYTQAVDIWSLGCVIYTILARVPPFMTTSSKRKPFPEAELKLYSSADAVNFVRTLLAKDPAERPTAKDARSNQWLMGSDDLPSQIIPSGPSQDLPSLLKTPAPRQMAGYPGSSQSPVSDLRDKTVVGVSSQDARPSPGLEVRGTEDSGPARRVMEFFKKKGQSSSSTRDSGPLQVRSARPSSPEMQRPVFGITLMNLFKRDGSAVPLVVYQCIQAVELYGLDAERIYANTGVHARVSTLKSQFDSGSQELDFRNPQAFYHDIKSVAALLKQFFRDLPDPLFTRDSRQSFIDAARINDDADRRNSIHAKINSLPDANYACVRALVLHLNRVVDHSATNKMNAGNLARVFGPTLLGQTAHLSDEGWKVRVVDTVLQNCLQIFDDD